MPIPGTICLHAVAGPSAAAPFLQKRRERSGLFRAFRVWAQGIADPFTHGGTRTAYFGTSGLILTGGQKMNIKSLLLGSAAALVAVTGARAADAVVIAEPEPMDYVRICDTYGTGFYYIPGTETCLKISGYLRYDIGGGDLFERHQPVPAKRPTTSARAPRSASTHAPRPSWARCVATLPELQLPDRRRWRGFDANDDVGFDHLYIELGGFRIGKTDSLFSTFTDYSSGVLTDGHRSLRPVRHQPDRLHLHGLERLLGRDRPRRRRRRRKRDHRHLHAACRRRRVLHAGWGKVGVVAGYDANLEDVAVKGRLDVNATEQLSLFVMAGYDSDGDNGGFDNGVFRNDASRPGRATMPSGAAPGSRSTTRRPSTPKSATMTAATSRLL